MRFFLVICLILSTSSFFAQDIKLITNSNGFRLNKNDFFLESGLNFEKVKLNHEFGIGIATNKTIFQKRFAPELYYVLKTNFKSKNKFIFQILSSYHLNFFNINRNEREVHFFNEVLTGFQFSYGKGCKLFFQPEAGFNVESYHSDFVSKVFSHLNYNYSAKIGFIYNVR